MSDVKVKDHHGKNLREGFYIERGRYRDKGGSFVYIENPKPVLMEPPVGHTSPTGEVSYDKRLFITGQSVDGGTHYYDVEDSKKLDIVPASRKDIQKKMRWIIENERNRAQRKINLLNKGLEGRTMVFGLSVLGGIVLSAFSLSSTGHVIGSNSLLTSGTGLLGLILFVVGLAGLIFGRK